MSELIEMPIAAPRDKIARYYEALLRRESRAAHDER